MPMISPPHEVHFWDLGQGKRVCKVYGICAPLLSDCVKMKREMMDARIRGQGERGKILQAR